MNTLGTISVAAALAIGMAATAARADTVIALSGDATLTSFDTKTLKAGKPVTVTGIPGRLLGIDMRPSDGQLYGLAADGTVVTIDAASGKATMKSKLETTLAAGVLATVDFNPVADRLRVIGSDGTNLRANVDDGKVITDGKLKFADTDATKGTPKIIAGSYTNSVKGSKETALYDIDATTGTFLKQAPPNDGVLGTLGKVGIPTTAISFDIATDGQGANRGWLVSDGMLLSVDLASGKSSPVGKVDGMPAGVRDIAVISVN